jgi:hypothetical protein
MIRPFVGWDGMLRKLIWVERKRKYFLRKGWTLILPNSLSGKSSPQRCSAFTNTIALSSEVDTGSREETASKQKDRASVLIPSEPKWLRPEPIKPEAWAIVCFGAQKRKLAVIVLSMQVLTQTGFRPAECANRSALPSSLQTGPIRQTASE